MSFPIEIRNKTAFRRVIRIARHTTFSTITTKYWNIHTPTLKPINLDKLQIEITRAFLCGTINIVELIERIHSQTERTIFEDEEPTLAFIKAVSRGGSNAN